MDLDYVICPFNKHHIISKLRIQYHLVKCKKKHPFSKKIVCPYDATEYIDPIDYTSHLYQCKKKKRLDVTEEFRQKQFVIHGDLTPKSYANPIGCVTDEWDRLNDANDDGNETLTAGEIKVLNLKSESSAALKKACAYSSAGPFNLGRGKGTDLYQNYIDSLHRTPENSSTSISVNFFPNVSRNLSEKESFYDSAEKLDEAGIYDDAEEQITSNAEAAYGYKSCHPNKYSSNSQAESYTGELYHDGQKHNDSRKVKSEKSTVHHSSGRSQATYDPLKECKSAMGRGVNKHPVSVGRGAALGRANFIRNSQLTYPQHTQTRTLDHIIKDIIADKTSTGNRQMSEANKRKSLPLQSSSVVSDCKAIFSKARSSSGSVNSSNTDKLPQAMLSDDMICFTKPPRSPNASNDFQNLLDTVVKQLPLTSLEDSSKSENAKESCDFNEGRNRSLNADRDVKQSSYLGRGHLFLNHNLQ